MQSMLSKWTMIWSLWLLCHLVLAGAYRRHHPCYKKFAHSGLAECRERLVAASKASQDHGGYDNKRSWNEGGSMFEDCFYKTYGSSDSQCLNPTKFKSAFLCLWDTALGDLMDFFMFDFKSRIEVSRLADRLRNCLEDFSEDK
ncbi:hypothetical protein MTO96_012619 [Rhipicephalus appendiculatus]